MKDILLGKLRSPKIVIADDRLSANRVKRIIETRPFKFASKILRKQDSEAVDTKQRHIANEKPLAPVERDVNLMVELSATRSVALRSP